MVLKAVCTHSLSIDAGVSALHKEYYSMGQTVRGLRDHLDGKTATDGLLKKIYNVNFMVPCMCVTDYVNYQRLTRTFVIPIKGDKSST